jgi:hypothetical protein
MAAKRTSKRIIKRLPYKCFCGEIEFKGTSSNISRTGLLIKTRKKLKPNSPVEIKLNLDEHHEITLAGVITRVGQVSQFDTYKQVSIGIKLTTVDQKYIEFMEALNKELS